MRITGSQTASLAALAMVLMIAADAQAYYHPGMGRFVSRDPGAGRTGLTGSAERGSFVPRDPTGSGQYADGMNLYQYARGNPVSNADPGGRVVVVISGLAQHHSNGRPLADKIADGIIREVSAGGFDASATVQVSMVMGGWGGDIGEDTLRDEYEAFQTRKKDNPCSLEQFVAVGHSDGATAIFHGLKDGTFGKSPTPAYLGLIDLVRISYFDGIGNKDPNTTESITKPEGTTVHNFRQTYGYGATEWKGRILRGADLNVDVNKDWGPWYVVKNGRMTKETVQLDHMTIFTTPEVHKQIAWRTAGAYIERVMAEVKADPTKKPWTRGTTKKGDKERW